MQSGGTPSRSKSEFYTGNIPWAKISDLEKSNDGYIYETEEHITEEALKSIIGMNLKYIGLMGSSKKSDSIFKHLTDEGINPELFKKVHTPVGIDINAESPEEIAISISAEIIKIKNQMLFNS